MRIELDGEACVGSATCVGFLPGAFRIGKEGHAQVVVGDAQAVDAAALAEAIGNCPVEAIRLVDAD